MFTKCNPILVIILQFAAAKESESEELLWALSSSRVSFLHLTVSLTILSAAITLPSRASKYLVINQSVSQYAFDVCGWVW
jgi:hypothetical protein